MWRTTRGDSGIVDMLAAEDAINNYLIGAP
jgi:hypothetical protein